MAITLSAIGAWATAHVTAIAMTTAATTLSAVALAATSAAMQSQQQNAQIKYQQEVQRQNMIAAQNKADADARTRRIESSRQQAAARAKMAASGVDSTSGSFLDLVGQGAAAGEMDVLKAKYDGQAEMWSLNNKINELETQKSNTALNATLSGLQAGISTASQFNWGGAAGAAGAAEKVSWGKDASGSKVGTTNSGKVYAPISSGIS